MSDQDGGGGETLDPTLSRNVSFSKLNARAPEFVPTRPPPPPPPPPPLPIQMHSVYPPPPPPPFHHRVPLHHHMLPLHHRPHHQQHYVPVRNPNPNPNHSRNTNNDDPNPDKSDLPLPDEAALHKLLNQVEYYFSDINLATTDHLMRFINKDPEGYVPLSVVASFKKVKAAVNNCSHLASILRKSSKLVVSEDEKKVKRLHPLTNADIEELQSRIVVAENLPEDHCHQNLMKIFSSVGSVRTIRTCPPQTAAGTSSASRSAKADGMHFSNKLHAFVEFESVDIAEKAVVELNDEGNWRSGLRVRLMLKRNSKSNQARGKKGHDSQGPSEEDEVSTSEQLPEKLMEDFAPQHDAYLHEQPGEDYVNERENVQRKGRAGKGRGKGRGRGQYHQNNRGNHVAMMQLQNNSVIGEQAGGVAKQPPGPRMPDGTRGFTMGRGKALAVNM